MTVEVAVVGLIQAVMVAVIGGFFARESKVRKKQFDKTEARASLRKEESRLAMKLMSANMGLSVATAMAIKEGQANGVMDRALLTAQEAQREYYGFVNSVAASRIEE